MLDLSSYLVRDDGKNRDYERGAAKRLKSTLTIMQKGGSIYILTNVNRTVLYIGVTSDLLSRLIAHREKKYPKSFTAKYGAVICIYYETFFSIEEAIEREKEIKKWRREKKNNLINSMNPSWKDLWDEVKEWWLRTFSPSFRPQRSEVRNLINCKIYLMRE